MILRLNAIDKQRTDFKTGTSSASYDSGLFGTWSVIAGSYPLKFNDTTRGDQDYVPAHSVAGSYIKDHTREFKGHSTSSGHSETICNDKQTQILGPAEVKGR